MVFLFVLERRLLLSEDIQIEKKKKKNAIILIVQYFILPKMFVFFDFTTSSAL
jgi:hypothetical protein